MHSMYIVFVQSNIINQLFYHYIAEEFKLVKIPRDFRSDPAKLVGLELHNRFKTLSEVAIIRLRLSVACLFIWFLIWWINIMLQLSSIYQAVVRIAQPCQLKGFHSCCNYYILYQIITTTFYIKSDISFHWRSQSLKIFCKIVMA